MKFSATLQLLADGHRRGNDAVFLEGLVAAAD